MNKISPAGPEDAKAKKNKAYRKARTRCVVTFLKNSAQRAAENRNCIGKAGRRWNLLYWNDRCSICACYWNRSCRYGRGCSGLNHRMLATRWRDSTAPEIPQAFKVDTSCPKYGNYDMTPYHTDNFTDIIIHPRGEENINIAAYYYPGDPSRNVAGETIILTRLGQQNKVHTASSSTYTSTTWIQRGFNRYT